MNFGVHVDTKKRGFDMYFTVFRRLQPFCNCSEVKSAQMNEKKTKNHSKNGSKIDQKWSLKTIGKGNPFEERFLTILEAFGTPKNVPKSIKMGGGHWENGRGTLGDSVFYLDLDEFWI